MFVILSPMIHNKIAPERAFGQVNFTNCRKTRGIVKAENTYLTKFLTVELAYTQQHRKSYNLTHIESTHRTIV